MYDATTPPEHDPDCSNYNPECRRELGKREKRDGIINLIFDGFGLLSGYRQDALGIVLTNLNVSIPAKSLDELLYSKITFESNLLPPYLLFMAGERRSQVSAQVLPYRDELEMIYQSRPRRATVPHKKREAQTEGTSNLSTLLIRASIGVISGLLLKSEAGGQLIDILKSSARKLLSPTEEKGRDADEERFATAVEASRPRGAAGSSASALGTVNETGKVRPTY